MKKLKPHQEEILKAIKNRFTEVNEMEAINITALDAVITDQLNKINRRNILKKEIAENNLVFEQLSVDMLNKFIAFAEEKIIPRDPEISVREFNHYVCVKRGIRSFNVSVNPTGNNYEGIWKAEFARYTVSSVYIDTLDELICHPHFIDRIKSLYP